MIDSLKDLTIAFILTWVSMLCIYFATLSCMKHSENILKEQNQQIIELLQNKE